MDLEQLNRVEDLVNKARQDEQEKDLQYEELFNFILGYGLITEFFAYKDELREARIKEAMREDLLLFGEIEED